MVEVLVQGKLAGLLRRCFPRSRAGFPGAESWASGRPELRLNIDRKRAADLGVRVQDLFDEKMLAHSLSNPRACMR